MFAFYFTLWFRLEPSGGHRKMLTENLGACFFVDLNSNSKLLKCRIKIHVRFTLLKVLNSFPYKVKCSLIPLFLVKFMKLVSYLINFAKQKRGWTIKKTIMKIIYKISKLIDAKFKISNLPWTSRKSWHLLKRKKMAFQVWGFHKCRTAVKISEKINFWYCLTVLRYL